MLFVLLLWCGRLPCTSVRRLRTCKVKQGAKDEGVSLSREQLLWVLQRAKGNLGSSTGWAPTHTDAQNILSTDASFNPFANWTHVFVPYGSGDVYIGTQRKPGIDGLYFAGHNTMEAVLDHLLNTTGLALELQTCHVAQENRRNLGSLAPHASMASHPRPTYLRPPT